MHRILWECFSEHEVSTNVTTGSEAASREARDRQWQTDFLHTSRAASRFRLALCSILEAERHNLDEDRLSSGEPHHLRLRSGVSDCIERSATCALVA